MADTVERDARLLALARNVRAGLQKALDYNDEVEMLYNALRQAQSMGPVQKDEP